MNFKQAPLRFEGAPKREVRTQFGALCYRTREDQVEILLVTSRNSGRWIIPKGWPMDGETPADAAKTEAFEEAGVEGKVFNICVGLFSYTKEMEGDNLPCAVSVFPLKVKKLKKNFPEMEERRRKWFPLAKAASRVREPELQKIIKNFDPAVLP